MLDILNGLEGTEYNNSGALMSTEQYQEVMSSLQGIKDPVKRAKLVQKLVAPPAASKGSRAEMEKHFGLLPKHIQEQLLNNELRLADTIIYSIVPISTKTTRVFEPQHARQIGMRSISEGRLQKGQVLLVSGIIMLAGVAASESPDDAMRTNFAKLEAIPAIANGEFSLKANKKIIVPEGTNNRVFATDNFHGVTLGYYKLANPRLIHDDVPIELVVELGSVTGIAANTQLFVGLHGTITTP